MGRATCPTHKEAYAGVQRRRAVRQGFFLIGECGAFYLQGQSRVS
eukprot:COSAG01_NODE_26311_length_718_cov_0.840065_1_plen_44_part_10